MARPIDVDVDDDENPPPCPWCQARAVVELTRQTEDVRMFMCANCARTFLIRCELLPPPR
jgi:transposase-like protein